MNESVDLEELESTLLPLSAVKASQFGNIPWSAPNGGNLESYYEALSSIFGDEHVVILERKLNLNGINCLGKNRQPGTGAIFLNTSTRDSYAKANKLDSNSILTVDDLLKLPKEQLDDVTGAQLSDARLTDPWRLVDWLEWDEAGGLRGTIERTY
jgi:hypothetical protein